MYLLAYMRNRYREANLFAPLVVNRQIIDNDVALTGYQGGNQLGEVINDNELWN